MCFSFLFISFLQSFAALMFISYQKVLFQDHFKKITGNRSKFFNTCILFNIRFKEYGSSISLLRVYTVCTRAHVFLSFSNDRLYFYYLEEIEAKGNPEARLKTVSKETRDILDTLKREYKSPEVINEEKKVADKFNAVSVH